MSNQCYDLNPNHFGAMATYTDGVHTHTLCDRHAEEAGFKARESADDLLSRVESYLNH